MAQLLLSLCQYSALLEFIILQGAFLVAQMIKNMPAKQETQVWVRKIPWRRKWQLTPVLLPREFHDSLGKSSTNTLILLLLFVGFSPQFLTSLPPKMYQLLFFPSSKLLFNMPLPIFVIITRHFFWSLQCVHYLAYDFQLTQIHKITHITLTTFTLDRIVGNPRGPGLQQGILTSYWGQWIMKPWVSY